MDVHGWIALATLVVAAVLFLTRWAPLELVALGIPVVLAATGTIPDPADALQGFGNHAVLALAAVFVLGAGLQESGVAALLARLVRRGGAGSEVRTLVIVCFTICILSAFMSNAATVAVLLPAVLALSRESEIPASRMLMPMGFAAILGGNLTLIGTAPNLLLSDFLEDREGAGFGMFDFALVGAPIALVGILFLVLVGRRLLPTRDAGERLRAAQLPERLASDYGLVGSLTRLRIGRNSKLKGRTLAEAAIGERYGLSVIVVQSRRGLGHRWLVPEPDYRFELGDQLYLQGDDEAFFLLAEEEETRIGLAGAHTVERVLDHGICLAEVAIAPRSPAVGRSLREIRFRVRFGLSVLSLWRRSAPVREDVLHKPLEVGDAFLVAGPAQKVRDLARGDEFVVLSDVGETRDFRRAPWAVLFLAVALVPPLFGWAPLALSALAGALLMAGTGCVSMKEAGRFIEWKVLALIVGTLPLGQAIDQHGVAQHAADAILAVASSTGSPAVLGALFLLAALVSVTSSNAAAAVILAPVAVRAAGPMEIEPRSALLAVAYGCSCAFLVPFAHQCNLMVMVPGGYRTKDFLVVGGAMSVVVATVAVALLATL